MYASFCFAVGILAVVVWKHSSPRNTLYELANFLTNCAELGKKKPNLCYFNEHSLHTCLENIWVYGI